MAFDGITTACLAHELSERLLDGRIVKIAQTESDELLLSIKPSPARGGGQVRLYLSANPSLPLVYLTDESRQAPLTAPAFCMLLRKHLMSGKITGVSQPALERILRFEVEHYNEMGDLCTHTLVIELMGKHSNIILTDGEDVITDSIKHISQMVSSVREVLPGRTYFIPETQGRTDPFLETEEAFCAKLAETEMPPASVLSRSYMGISQVMAQELCFRAGVDHDRSAGAMTGEEAKALWHAFHGLLDEVKNGSFTPSVYCGIRGGDREEPQEYAAVPLTMLEENPGVLVKRYDTVSELLESYYREKNARTRIRQKSADLRRITSTALERTSHKLDLQTKQMEDTEKREKYRLYGELLTAYGHGIPAGAKDCEVDNYYTGEKVRIRLDETLTASQNAQRYFDRYAKLKRTAQALESLLEETRTRKAQLEMIQLSLDMAQTEGDLIQVRQELEQEGFVKRTAVSRKGKERSAEGKPMHYVSSDGYDLFVGRNNIQNDQISFHLAAPSDIWFHANDIPGSHVILKTNGEKMDDIPDRVFEEAASLAAWYSKGREQSTVEIDYLERRHLKKPAGAAPGFVVYYTNYSIRAKADISALKQVQ